MTSDDANVDTVPGGTADELEPVVLAHVSEVTEAAPDGALDHKNIVWGDV